MSTDRLVERFLNHLIADTDSNVLRFITLRDVEEIVRRFLKCQSGDPGVAVAPLDESLSIAESVGLLKQAIERADTPDGPHPFLFDTLSLTDAKRILGAWAAAGLVDGPRGYALTEDAPGVAVAPTPPAWPAATPPSQEGWPQDVEATVQAPRESEVVRPHTDIARITSGPERVAGDSGHCNDSGERLPDSERGSPRPGRAP